MKRPLRQSLEREIRAQLKDIETAKEVRVLYACESGSRAWGFPSADSDYDVRFIEAKRRGEELDRGPRIAPVSEFVKSELARLENKRFEQEYHRPIAPVDEFNDLFRSALEEVWSSYVVCNRSETP